MALKRYDVNVELAVKYGTDISSVLSNIDKLSNFSINGEKYLMFMSTKHFQSFYPYWSNQEAITIINKLKKLNLAIKVFTNSQEIKEAVLKNKECSTNINSIFPNTCEWCGNNTIVLHEHHYPLKKSKGGTETVNICPNCHYEFHALENSYLINGCEQ